MSQFTSPVNSQVLQSLLGSLQAPDQKSLMAGAFGSNPIVSSFAQMMQQANQANATRGGDILQLLAGQGQAQQAQNQQNYQQQLSGINQSMMSKGLANTSVGNNLNQEAQNNLAQNNEAVNEHTALNLANMANSFTQQAPSMGLLAQLLQNGNRGGGGGMTINTGAGPGGLNAPGIGASDASNAIFNQYVRPNGMQGGGSTMNGGAMQGATGTGSFVMPNGAAYYGPGWGGAPSTGASGAQGNDPTSLLASLAANGSMGQAQGFDPNYYPSM